MNSQLIERVKLFSRRIFMDGKFINRQLSLKSRNQIGVGETVLSSLS
jgi:hypothetical protein